MYLENFFPLTICSISENILLSDFSTFSCCLETAKSKLLSSLPLTSSALANSGDLDAKSFKRITILSDKNMDMRKRNKMQ